MFDRSGFAASAGLRLAGAATFALLAFGSVVVIEGSGDPPAITARPTATAANGGRLRIEATFPVARWTVQIQGTDVVPLSSGPQRFECDLHGDLATVFIQAEPADATSTAAGALRWTFSSPNGNHSGLLWGEGSVADTIHPAADAGGSR
jgi:hypothetical protein